MIKMANNSRIQLMLPNKTADVIDCYVGKGYFSDRQSAIRFLVRVGIDNFNPQSVEVTE
ncbi:MAG: hypothetical protein RBR02_09450 [Desulfuromonadaceae bacterium]|nr:hypothetical protein [Desulfuromonadaceae bacterium]